MFFQGIDGRFQSFYTILKQESGFKARGSNAQGLVPGYLTKYKKGIQQREGQKEKVFMCLHVFIL